MSKYKILFLTSYFLLFSILSMAQQIEGSWGGNLKFSSGTNLRIIFNIKKVDSVYITTLDSPDQMAKGIITKSTSFRDSILNIEMPALGGASYNGKLGKDNKIEGVFRQQGADTPLILSLGDISLNRPQTPKPPYPYIVEEVKFFNPKDSIYLAGTLTLPLFDKSKPPYPAVILLTGSGGQNRDEEIFEHKPFMVIADYLTRNGIAVLRFDDRGIGESEGNFGLAIPTDFVSDAQAAIEYLRSRKNIDQGNIDISKLGLLGHSEGGSIAFRVGAADENLDFIISFAGPGVKGDSLMLKQAEMIYKSQGMNDIGWAMQAPILRNRYKLLTQDKSREVLKEELYADVTKTIPPSLLENKDMEQKIEKGIAAMTSQWYLDFMRYDPIFDFKKIKCPVFALNGAKDIQVDADMNLNSIEYHIKLNGNKNVLIRKYDGLNHLFQEAKLGTVPEYKEIEQTISPKVLEDIKDWILSL